MEKDLRYEIPAVISAIVGIFFVITAFVAPSQYTEFSYEYPQLSWFVTFTSRGASIAGTGPQAPQLQFVIGIIFLALAYLLHRHA